MGNPIDPTTKGLLDGMSRAILSRRTAAEILQKVAEAGSYGSFPSDVTCEQLGKALFRIVMNSPEEQAFLELIKGWRAAEHDFLERCAG